MGDQQREDFERRLLALVRSQLEFMDRDYPDGWEITDFVVSARFYAAPGSESERLPWEGGPFPGWGLNQWTRGTAPTYWHDEEVLESALRYTRRLMKDYEIPADDDEA